MRYLHTMLRVSDLEAALGFFAKLGLREVRRESNSTGRYTLVFLKSEDGDASEVELTHNWDHQGRYAGGRNFGHLAFEVEDIYAACRSLAEENVTILRPPRDGRMAFIRTPDDISIELLQKGEPLAPVEPWCSEPNRGEW